MKPDWDKLAAAHARSDKLLIADVDCTGAGEPLCERFGVEGFPTLKSFSPPDDEGEDYEGGRTYDVLAEFAAKLGPGCSADKRENCSAEQLAELETTLAMPEADRESELAGLKKELKKAKAEHEALSERLQNEYEESEKRVEETKSKVRPCPSLTLTLP